MTGLFFSSGIDRDFEKDLARMQKKLNSFSKNAQTQTTIMSKSFKSVANAVGGFVSVMAIGAAGKELINFTIDLETALTEVSTISKEVTDNFDEYKNSILELSTESATSAIKLTDAFYDIVSAGYDGAKGLELLAAAEKASTAGFVEVGTAADGLTTVLNAWGKDVSEAGKVSDIFFKTVEKGKTTFPELGANIAQVAPLAASMGVSFEEIQGAMATLTKQGTPTSQAFTQIRGALIAMNQNLGDGWSNMYTFQEAAQRMTEIAGGSSNELKTMVGRIEGVNAILGLTGKNAGVAADDLAAMNEALGATNTAAEKVVLSTAQQLSILKNNILAALEPLGDDAKELLGNLAKRLTTAFQAGDVQKYAKILVQLGKAFITYKVSVIALTQVQKLQRVAMLANIKAMRITAQTSKTVTGANVLMANSFRAISTAFKSNPIGLISTGLAIAIPLITKFVKKQKELTTFAGKVGKAVAEETYGVNELFEQLKKTNPESEKAKKIREELNEKFPDLLSNYDLEKGNLEDIEKAQSAVNDEIIKTIALKQQDIALEQARAEKVESYSKIVKKASNAIVLKKYGSEGEITAAFENIRKDIETEGLSVQQAANKAAKQLGITITDELIDIDGASTNFGVLVGFIEKVAEANKDFASTQEEVNKFIKDFNAALGETQQLTVDDGSKLTEEQLNQQKEQQKKADKARKEAANKAREEALYLLELENQERINSLTARYEGEEKLEQEYHNKLLKQRLDYLSQLKELSSNELDKLKIDEEILKIKIELDSSNTLSDQEKVIKELQKKYQTYTEQRKEIEEKYNKDIIKLQKANQKDFTKVQKQANNERIELAKQRKKAEIDQLNKQLVEQNEILQNWIEKELPKLTANAAEALQLEIKAQLKLETDEKEIAYLEEKLEAISTYLTSFSEGINMTSTIDQLDQMSASFLRIVEGMELFGSNTGGLVDTLTTIVGAVLDLKYALDELNSTDSNSLASSSLATAGAVITIVDSLFQYQDDLYLERQALQASELAASQAYSLELSKQIALYEEGNSYFSDDKWGTALSGLTAYNDALGVYNDTLQDIQDSDVSLSDSGFQFHYKHREEYLKLQIQKAAKDNETELEKALDKLTVRTAERSFFIKSLGIGDEYKSLLHVYPELIDAQGELDTAVLQTVLDTADLDEATKQYLQNLQEATLAAEEYFAVFGEYISDIFGNVGDEVAQAFQTMYESGTDAMGALEQSFSEMIESFTRDAIEFAYLQPLISELNDITSTLGEQYASGQIDSNELQSGVIKALGDFYDNVNKQQANILNAYKQADLLAEKAGFESAFNPDEKGVEDTITIIPTPEPDPIKEDNNSLIGVVRDSITEETGSMLVGRMGAIMLSNQQIVNNTDDLLGLAINHLTTLNKIKENTDYLPEIAINTRRTFEQLQSY